MDSMENSALRFSEIMMVTRFANHVWTFGLFRVKNADTGINIAPRISIKNILSNFFLIFLIFMQSILH